MTTPVKTLDYERGYQAGYHKGQRSQRAVVPAKSDPMTAYVILCRRWPDAAIGEVHTFGGHSNEYIWTGLAWEPKP